MQEGQHVDLFDRQSVPLRTEDVPGGAEGPLRGYTSGRDAQEFFCYTSKERELLLGGLPPLQGIVIFIFWWQGQVSIHFHHYPLLWAEAVATG